MAKTVCFVLMALAVGMMIMLAGCGGNDNEEENDLVSLDITNLSQIQNPAFTYTAWVNARGDIVQLDSFNTQADGSQSLSRFAITQSLVSGDEVFVTIEPVPAPEPFIPSNTRVLTGTIQGNTAQLVFPELQGFANTTGFVTVSGAGNRQLLVELFNLPDVSSNNFIYQNWLDVNGGFIPLSKFNFNEVPVSETASFDVTTARYFLSVEPVPDPDPNRPFSIVPLSTNGNLQALIRQPLVRSSLTPGTPNFNFPSAVATVQ